MKGVHTQPVNQTNSAHPFSELAISKTSDKSTFRQQEFGLASMMSRVLRESFSSGMSEICQSYVSNKLAAKFRSIAAQESGRSGARPLNPSKHGRILHGFEFNTEAPYRKIFDAKYYVKPGSKRGQVILHFPAFIPEQALRKPEAATNFKINARLVALSDFEYDKISNSYHPRCKELHGLFGSFESPMLPLLKIPTEPMTSQVSIQTPETLPNDLGLFLVMAISFYRYENSRFLHLPKSSGMQIHEVY